MFITLLGTPYGFAQKGIRSYSTETKSLVACVTNSGAFCWVPTEAEAEAEGSRPNQGLLRSFEEKVKLNPWFVLNRVHRCVSGCFRLVSPLGATQNSHYTSGVAVPSAPPLTQCYIFKFFNWSTYFEGCVA